MARNRYRPGRNVAVFFVGLAIAFGLVAIAGNLDAQARPRPAGRYPDHAGGHRGRRHQRASSEAASIIDGRVNGSGVSEAEVTTQGNRFVVVEIPGQNRRDLVDTVKRQAQLRFRVVACTAVTPAPAAARVRLRRPRSSLRFPAPASPCRRRPTPSRGAAARRTGRRSSPRTASSRRRAAGPAVGVAEPHANPPEPAPEGDLVDQPLKWMNRPDQASIKAFNDYECPPAGEAAGCGGRPGKAAGDL